MAEESWVENHDKNGVRFRVTKFASGISTVDASCLCFGSEKRVHSSSQCPNRLRLIDERERKQVLNSYVNEEI